MLRLVVLGLAASMAMASPLHDISIGGALLQGNFKIGEAAESGLYSAVSVDYMVEKMLRSVKNEASLEKLFNEFKQLYNKSYKSGEHEKSAKDLFIERLLMVLENNLKAAHKQSSYILALQAGSDTPLEELLLQPAGQWPSTPNAALDGSAVNESSYANNWVFDYRQQHKVTSVVSQGNCGACVYFAAAATIESLHARQGHGLVHLSPQQLNDCARDDAHGNHGCQHGGGTFVPTFNYIKAHGLASEHDYPYVSHDAACRRDKEAHPAARIRNWHPVLPHGDEMALERSVHDHGPNAVAVHVNDAFMHYKGGILDSPCHGGRNHAVMVVGYGRENEKDFWIIKNQWTDRWGEKGFMRLGRKHGNLCDVAGDAVWVE